MHSKKELPFMNDHCMAVFTGQTAKIYQSVTGDRHLIPHPGFKASKLNHSLKTQSSKK